MASSLVNIPLMDRSNKRGREYCNSHIKHNKESMKDLTHLHIPLSSSICNGSGSFDFYIKGEKIENCRYENDLESKITVGRQSHLLKRWTSRETCEMITTIERQTHEAEILALSSYYSVSNRASTFIREASPCHSESSMDVPNLRASSLVTMWKELEAEARTRLTQNRTSGGSSPSSCRTNAMSNDDNDSSTEDPSINPDTYDSERFDSMDEEFAEGETDKKVGGENRKVADIIKTLTSNNPPSNIRMEEEIKNQNVGKRTRSLDLSIFGQGENSILPFRCFSPRVRGRQAIIDLFKHLECARQKELDGLAARHAVTQFAHRNRIQAILRFKFLRGSQACQDKYNHFNPTSTRQDQTRKDRPIIRWWSRTDTKKEGDSSGIMGVSTRYTHTLNESSCTEFNKNITCEEKSEGIHESIPSINEQFLTENEVLQEEIPLDSEIEWQDSEVLIDFNESTSGSNLHRWEESMVAELDAQTGDQHAESSEEENWPRHPPTPRREFQRQRRTFHQFMESDNAEIQELLERSIVSTSLASGFRQKLDRLVLSLLQMQGHPDTEDSIGINGDYEEEEVEEEEEVHEVIESNPEEYTSLEVSLPSAYRDSHQRSSSFLLHSLHRSTEMELIHDLRCDMSQLRNEICELRRSLESCTATNIKMQPSIDHAISDSMCNSAESLPTLHLSKTMPMKKGNCYICYERQVDSLLYRCGHICTCFKCAHELQWSSGRCPICRAEILDVVRAYFDG